MPSFAAMEARIIAELHRDDVAMVVDDYINDAINHYSRFRFWFNETSATAVTVAGTATYAWPTDMVQLDSMTLTNGTVVKPMQQWSPREMDQAVTSTTPTGEPFAYSTYNKLFRLYPVPGAVYTLTYYYVKNFTALTTGSATSNVWTTEAEELIRTRAKKLLVGHFIPSSQDSMGWAQMLDAAEQDIFAGLQRQTSASTRTGRIRAWNA